jgi:hypothetical protein
MLCSVRHGGPIRSGAGQTGLAQVSGAQVGPDRPARSAPLIMKVPQPQRPRMIEEFSNLGGRQVCHVHDFDSETAATRHRPSSAA